MNVVHFSGGKDSSAMLLRMIELEMPIDKIVFADTTFEFPEMYDWVQQIQQLISIKITILKPKHSWDKWFYGKWTRGKKKGEIRGFPMVVSPCWWSRDAKVVPLEKESTKGDTIFLGFAINEIKRSKAKRYSKGDKNFRFPLIEWNWTEEDCLNYLQSKGLRHPCYTNKVKRTGCWLCPKQSVGALKQLYTNYPNLWKRLKKYERDSPHGFRPRFSLDKFEKEILG